MATFGYEEIGDAEGWCDDTVFGSLFTCPEDGVADSITVYGCAAGMAPTKFKAAIYRHSDLALIGSTEEKELPAFTEPHWDAFNFSAPKPGISNVGYILVLWANLPSIVGYPHIKTAGGVADQGHKDSEVYNDFPNPFVLTSHDGSKCSIYCTYTPTPANPLIGKPLISPDIIKKAKIR